MVPLHHSPLCKLLLESANDLLRRESSQCSGNGFAELLAFIFLLLLTSVYFGGNLNGDDCQNLGAG